MSSTICDRIGSAENLPSLPAVAVKVLELTQAADVSVADIAQAIQNDPALTSRILRVVNSSLFGMSREISSLRQAVMVLGLRTVRVMVLSFSLVDAMDRGRPNGFDYTGYWRRSLTTAVAARLLAEQVKPALTDEAFVGGLLCDIGMLAAVRCAGDAYAPVIEGYSDGSVPFQQIEQELLGTTHEAISCTLLNKWGLPESLCTAVATHHAPLKQEESAPSVLIGILRASAAIADLFCSDTRADRLDALKQAIATALGMEKIALERTLDRLDQHVKETASLFSLTIGQTLSYQDLQAGAVAQLARLSMDAEIERTQLAQREEQARRRVAMLNDENRELAQKASTDGLTGIANRAALEQRLRRDCTLAINENRPIGMILLDIDHFKKLNDTYGHPAGDEALRRVGSCLREIQSEAAFAARYGGEEFAMIVLDTTAKAIRELAEDVRQRVQQLCVTYEKNQIEFTASIGVAYMNPDDPALDPQQLISLADQGLYDAKRGGRNRVAGRTRSKEPV